MYTVLTWKYILSLNTQTTHSDDDDNDDNEVDNKNTDDDDDNDNPDNHDNHDNVTMMTMMTMMSRITHIVVAEVITQPWDWFFAHDSVGIYCIVYCVQLWLCLNKKK